MEDKEITKEEVLTENQENVEGLFFMLENEENVIESHKKETVRETPEREEQERTRIKKKLFFEHYASCEGVISMICRKVGIDNKTFYQWKKDDPDFVANLEKLRETINDEVEDILMGLVKIKKDPSCVKYYLDRRDPRYRPKQEFGGLNGEPLPPIRVEIIPPKNGNTNTTENDTGDSSLPKEPTKPEENKGE
jgi:hypothetical protein